MNRRWSFVSALIRCWTVVDTWTDLVRCISRNWTIEGWRIDCRWGSLLFPVGNHRVTMSTRIPCMGFEVEILDFWHVSCFYGGPLLLSNPWPLLVTREYTSLSTPLYRPRNLKKLPGFPSMKALRLRKIPSFPCVYYRFMCHLSLYMLWNAFKYTS